MVLQDTWVLHRKIYVVQVLNLIKNAKLKQALCKLRVSNHDLTREIS